MGGWGRRTKALGCRGGVRAVATRSRRAPGLAGPGPPSTRAAARGGPGGGYGGRGGRGLYLAGPRHRHAQRPGESAEPTGRDGCIPILSATFEGPIATGEGIEPLAACGRLSERLPDDPRIHPARVL